jgi:hypothetical protein
METLVTTIAAHPGVFVVVIIGVLAILWSAFFILKGLNVKKLGPLEIALQEREKVIIEKERDLSVSMREFQETDSMNQMLAKEQERIETKMDDRLKTVSLQMKAKIMAAFDNCVECNVIKRAITTSVRGIFMDSITTHDLFIEVSDSQEYFTRIMGEIEDEYKDVEMLTRRLNCKDATDMVEWVTARKHVDVVTRWWVDKVTDEVKLALKEKVESYQTALSGFQAEGNSYFATNIKAQMDKAQRALNRL